MGEEDGLLFGAAKTGMAKLLKLVRERQDITQYTHQLLDTLNKLTSNVSEMEREAAGGALVITAKLLLPPTTTDEKLTLIPLFTRAFDLVGSFERLPSFHWVTLQPLLHQYLDAIPEDTPGTTQFLELIAKVFSVMNESPKINDEFFSFANILSVGRVITKSLDVVKNVDRDKVVRTQALDVLSRLIEQCPPKKAPVIGMVVSGILSGLMSVLKGSVNTELLDKTVNLFGDTIILVFADNAVKFDRNTVNKEDFKGEMYSFVENHNEQWRAEAVRVINEYVKHVMSSYMIYRVNCVKKSVCELVCRIQRECGKTFEKTLYPCILGMYTYLRFEDSSFFQELAISCLPLVDDRSIVEQYFYKELENISRRLPVQTRSHAGDRELNVLAAVLDGLGESVTLMFTTGSETIEKILRCLIDCIVIDKKGLLITSEGVSESLDQELRKFRLEFALSHRSVKHICSVLAELGGVELIAMMHSLMQDESSGRRASYHILLAYMLNALDRKEAMDDPIIFMLAEFLVEEANNSYSIEEKDDENPYEESYENDWDNCIESLSCTNVALCMKLVGVTANRSHISVNCLCVILNQTISRTWFIAETAEFALKILTESDKNVSDVYELVRVYNSHILNTVALACCSSEEYHMAPHLLKAYLRYAEIDDQFDQFRVISEKMLHALDSNEQTFTVALLQALLSFLAALNKQFPDIHPISPPEDAEDQRSRPVPQHIITEKILLRTKHMLTSPHLCVRLICLDILGEGIDILKHYDDMLLPMIHQNWHGIMSIVREEDPIAMTSAFEQIVNMADKAGNFIHNKVLREFWPAAERFLVECIRMENIYQHSAEYRLIVKYIDRVPFLVVNAGLTEQEADESLVKILDLAIREERNFVSFSKTQKEQLTKHFKDLAVTGENN